MARPPARRWLGTQLHAGLSVINCLQWNTVITRIREATQSLFVRTDKDSPGAHMEFLHAHGLLDTNAAVIWPLSHGDVSPHRIGNHPGSAVAAMTRADTHFLHFMAIVSETEGLGAPSRARDGVARSGPEGPHAPDEERKRCH